MYRTFPERIQREIISTRRKCVITFFIYIKKMSAHLTKMTGGHFYFSTIRKLLMLFTQQIVHGLYRIESTQRNFYEHGIPVAH